jgi:hypothetical protein
MLPKDRGGTMGNSERIHSQIDGRPDQDLAEQLYDPEWYEEIEYLNYLTHPEVQEVHRMSLSDAEWKKMVDEWGEEYP